MRKITRRAYASWSSLGLRNSPVVQNALVSLQQLPDVTHALEHPFGTQAMESLHRAYEIFDHISSNGAEVQALLALTAELQVLRGESSVQTLEQLMTILQQSTKTNESSRTVSMLHLACAKSHWMQGNFVGASQLCQQVLNDNSSDTSVTVAARNGYALSQLLQAETMDDLFVVRDPFRRNALHHTKRGAAAMNFGAAQVVYGDVLSMHRPDADIPLDPALREWKQGLAWWKKNSNSNNNSNPMALLLQSQLNANMAWGLLQLQEIEQASKYAHDSLKLLEQQQQKVQPSLALTLPLTLLAQCYHKSGAAVTAEGLLQTSTTSVPRTLIEKLHMRYALKAYDALCRDWDKRAGDAERLTAQADQMDLPGAWKRKDAFVYTSLWFWMPGDL